MSIQHTVVFRLIHEAGSEAETDFLAAARSILPAIPGVTDFVVNRQVSAKSDLSWQFSMVFASQEDYDAYDAHPPPPGLRRLALADRGGRVPGVRLRRPPRLKRARPRRSVGVGAARILLDHDA